MMQTFPFEIPSGITIIPEISGSVSLGTTVLPFETVSANTFSGNNIYRQGVELTNYTLPATVNATVFSGTMISGNTGNFTGNLQLISKKAHDFNRGMNCV